MLNKILTLFKDKDLRKKFLFLFAFLAAFRLLAAIPVPGIDPAKLEAFFSGNQFFGLLNVFSGGALDNLSVVMLGVGPYITGSIIMQLLTMIFPGLKAMYQEEGEAGRQKFNQFSRLFTFPLALLQGFGLLTILERQGVIAFDSGEKIGSMIIVAAGSILLMWIGELISEYSIGNGISVMIFAGIVSGVPLSVGQTLLTFDKSQLPTLISFLIIAIVTIAAVVIITEGERQVPVYYAKRVRGMKMYGGVSTHLPIRVNQAGVIPIIFALSILLFPQMIASFFSSSSNSLLSQLSIFILGVVGNPWTYASAYFLLVVIFTYFYTSVTFDPDSMSQNLQRSGAFVPGIRPGPPTSEFFYKIVNRITLVGALFLGGIAVLPLILQGVSGVTTFTIGGTALLIVVSVVIETAKQIEAQLSLRSYD